MTGWSDAAALCRP